MILSVSPFRLTLSENIIYTAETRLSEFLDGMTIFTAPSVINPPWRSYRMEVSDWVAVFYFKEQNLWRISLTSTLIESYWSEQSAIAVKRWHDEWLEKNLGLPPYEYSWGQIRSFGSERSGSGIGITFLSDETEPTN